MTDGTTTYNGLGVPLFGASTIMQQAAGEQPLTIRSVADNTACNLMTVGHTSTSAITTGYTQCFYANINLDGGATSSRNTQVHAFAADITIDGTMSAQVGGCYIYIAEGSTGATLTSSTVFGYAVYFAATGSTPHYRIGFWASSAEVAANKGSVMDAAFFADNSAALGCWESVIGVQGITSPTYLLHMDTAPGTEDMISTGIRANIAAADVWMRVKIQSTEYWIALHASCTS